MLIGPAKDGAGGGAPKLEGRRRSPGTVFIVLDENPVATGDSNGEASLYDGNNCNTLETRATVECECKLPDDCDKTPTRRVTHLAVPPHKMRDKFVLLGSNIEGPLGAFHDLFHGSHVD